MKIGICIRQNYIVNNHYDEQIKIRMKIQLVNNRERYNFYIVTMEIIILNVMYTNYYYSYVIS